MNNLSQKKNKLIYQWLEQLKVRRKKFIIYSNFYENKIKIVKDINKLSLIKKMIKVEKNTIS
jgi:hypothetical protein